MVLTLFVKVSIFEAKGQSFTFCNFKHTWWAQPDEGKQ